MNRKEYMKQYRQSEKGKIVKTINQWKRRGLKLRDNETYDKIYDIYLNSKNCNLCQIEFNELNKNKKCMDHDNETGYFRDILCRSCNLNSKKRRKDFGNLKHIRLRKDTNSYQCYIQLNKKEFWYSNQNINLTRWVLFTYFLTRSS